MRAGPHRRYPVDGRGAVAGRGRGDGGVRSGRRGGALGCGVGGRGIGDQVGGDSGGSGGGLLRVRTSELATVHYQRTPRTFLKYTEVMKFSSTEFRKNLFQIVDR